MRDNVVYELQTKTEHFIVFKLFKILALFGVTWFVLRLASFMFLGFTGIRDSDVVSDVVLYSALALAGYYVFLKVASTPVERVIFDYNNNVVIILYKNYFFHITSTRNFSLDALSSTLRKKQSFFQGQYLELTIFYRLKRIAFIGKGASDWQRIPNFITRIHERIAEVNPNGADLIVEL